MIPPALNRVVKTCLAKDPEDRFQTAHDAKLQLEWIAEGGSQVGLPAPVAARRKSREKLAWAIAAVAIVAAALAAYGYLRRAPKPLRLTRFEISTPEEIVALDAPRVSPDGRYVAFNATDSSGKTRIWLRALNALAPQPLPGTEGTTRPFWSPGLPVSRLLRRRQAEEDRRDRRAAARTSATRRPAPTVRGARRA